MKIQTLQPLEDAFSGKVDFSADEVGFDFGVGNLETRIFSLQNPDGSFFEKINLQPETTFNIRAFAVVGDETIYGNVVECSTDENSKFLITDKQI